MTVSLVYYPHLIRVSLIKIATVTIHSDKLQIHNLKVWCATTHLTYFTTYLAPAKDNDTVCLLGLSGKVTSSEVTSWVIGATLLQNCLVASTGCDSNVWSDI